jgi:phage terminase small subunit
MTGKKLTPKQKKFVKEYQKDLNGTQAAKRAGYSEHTAQEIASENLSKPIIKEAINKDLDNTLQKLGIDAEYILGGIKKTIERCETDDKPDSGAILKGFELLGKYKNLKIWTDKIEHSGDKENPIVVAPINLEERAALLKKANDK